jgi:hypothetical protein
MRHPNVRNADEVDVREMIKGRHNMRLRQLGKPAGSSALGATLTEEHIRTTQEGARAKGIKLAVLKARTEAAIDAAFEQLQARALLVSADAFFNRCRAQLVALSARYAIPAMYYSPRWVCLPIMPSERSADGDRRAK